MTCTQARSCAAEHALGVLDAGRSEEFERHVRWCAACRQEAVGFGTAAAMLGFAASPAAPGEHLAGDVIAAVHEATGSGRQGNGRRGRLAVAVALAGLMALSGLGWGAVMAGRAARSDEQAQAAEQARQDALARFQELLEAPELAGVPGEASVAHLVTDPNGDAPGATGEAVVVASGLRGALVTVAHLPLDQDRLPYVVRLGGPGRDPLVVGKIRRFDGDEGIVSRIFDVPLVGYTSVVVRDGDDRVVLRGVLDARAPLSPRR